MLNQSNNALSQLAEIAEGRGLTSAANLLREAQADIIAANKGPFSASEKKELGPIADVMEAATAELAGALQGEMVSLLMDRAENSMESLRHKIRSERGSAGLAVAEPYIKRWFLDLMERACSDELITALEDRLGELETVASDSVDDGGSTDELDEPEPRSAQTRSASRNRRRPRSARQISQRWRKAGMNEEADRLDLVADHVAASG